MSNPLTQLELAREVFVRADGWFSALTSFGTSKDKRQSVGFYLDIITDDVAESLWRSDDVAARIIEDLPCEALRQGIEVVTDDKQQAEEIVAKLEELEAIPKTIQAKHFARAYGGGALFPIINDGVADLSQPLNEQRIPEITHIQTLESRELQPAQWYTDPLEPKFGVPKTWNIIPRSRGGLTGQGVGAEIHESRLIIFQGIVVSRNQSSVNNGWGDSVLNRAWQVLRDFNIGFSSSSVLMHEFSQAEIKMKGLAELMATDRDEIVRNRIKAIELSRSTINAVLLDSEEEYERKQTPVTGLPELLEKHMLRLAAAADMPVTRLMGQSPAGMNATGESDQKFYYDRIAVDRQFRTRPQLERLVKLIMLSKNGPTKGQEPKTWSVKFPPLFQPTEKEIAETRRIVAETDRIYIQEGVFGAGEVLKNRYGGDTYSADFVVEDGALDNIDETTPIDPALLKPTEQEGTAEKENVQASAMNGGQITSLIGVVSSVNKEEISRESGIAILRIAFRVSQAEAEEILGPEDFEPTKPEPKPNPFIQGQPPQPEGEQPEGDKPEDQPEEGDQAEEDQTPPEDRKDEVRLDYIEQHPDGFWCVYSESGKLLGKHKTKAEAEAQLHVIEAMKHEK